MVNPGGTGRPMRLISARPAPFPPSRSRIVALPSAKSIVHRPLRGLLAPGAVRVARVFGTRVVFLLRTCAIPSPHRHLLLAVSERRSEEHTSELQSQSNLVCRPL